MSDNWKIDIAKWTLERNLGWVAAAEVKVGFVITVNIAMTAGIGAVAASAKSFNEWAVVASLATAILLIGSAICIALCLTPRTEGPDKSLVFFGSISKMDAAAYPSALKTASVDSLILDIGAQIHRNAEIAKEKHRWAGLAIRWTLGALMPWMAAILLLAYW